MRQMGLHEPFDRLAVFFNFLALDRRGSEWPQVEAQVRQTVLNLIANPQDCVWTRLLTWADVARFGTRGIPFMAAATAAITSTVAIVSWQLFCALQSKITRPIPMNGTSTSSGWFHKSDQTPDMAPIINAVDRTTQNCPRTERT